MGGVRGLSIGYSWRSKIQPNRDDLIKKLRVTIKELREYQDGSSKDWNDILKTLIDTFNELEKQNVQQR